ncbi:MAG: hypothetical protein HQ595_02755 [Candidatus Omnitrophica bacterium]|nr:hypothetical protein [Candidatus Omnitrophota bacterium]
MKKKFICGLDIGTFKTCATCGTVDAFGKIDILATETVRTLGVQRGKVIDNRQLTASVREAFEKLRKNHHIRVRRIYVNIDSPDLKTKLCEQSLKFREKTRLNKSHIFRLVDSCLSSQASLNRKVIHTGSRIFRLDNQTDCLDPEGRFAYEAKLSLAVVTVLIPTIKNFTKCIKAAGLRLEEVVPSGSAQALGLFRDINRATSKFNILIDVGSQLTKLYLLRDRLLKDSKFVLSGSQAISEDIAQKLQVSFDCAEQLKTKYGRTHYENGSVGQKIIIKDGLTNRVVQLPQLNEIIGVGADSLLQQITRALQELNYAQEELDEIVVTGGGSILEGFLERADRVLGRPVKMGFLSSVRDNHIQTHSAIYATSIGLIHLGSQNRPRLSSFTRLKFAPLMRAFNWARDLYHEYF